MTEAAGGRGRCCICCCSRSMLLSTRHRPTMLLKLILGCTAAAPAAAPPLLHSPRHHRICSQPYISGRHRRIFPAAAATLASLYLEHYSILFTVWLPRFRSRHHRVLSTAGVAPSTEEKQIFTDAVDVSRLCFFKELLYF